MFDPILLPRNQSLHQPLRQLYNLLPIQHLLLTLLRLPIGLETKRSSVRMLLPAREGIRVIKEVLVSSINGE